MTYLNPTARFPYFKCDFNLTQELISNELDSDPSFAATLQKIFRVVAVSLVAAFEAFKNGILIAANGIIALINAGYQKYQVKTSDLATAVLLPKELPPESPIPKRGPENDPELLSLWV